MRVLSESQYQLEAEFSLRQIFVHDDPFEAPFAKDVVARRLIFDYHYQITPPLTNAVIAAASNIGDLGLYISSLWRPPSVDWPEPWHWYLSFDEFLVAYVGDDELGRFAEFKLENIYGAEHVLYSPQGKWGIMISHEHFGFLGGEENFVQEVSQIFPGLDRQVYDYLDYLRQSTEDYIPDLLPIGSYGWLPSILSNVYGEKPAQKMLQNVGLRIEDYN